MDTVAVNTQHGFQILFNRVKNLEMQVLKLKQQEDEWRLKFDSLGTFLHKNFGFDIQSKSTFTNNRNVETGRDGGGEQVGQKRKKSVDLSEVHLVHMGKTKVNTKPTVVMDGSIMKTPVLNFEHLYPKIEVKKYDGVFSSTTKSQHQSSSSTVIQEKQQQSSCTEKSMSGVIKEPISHESWNSYEVIDLDPEEPVNPTVIVEPPHQQRNKIKKDNEKTTVKDKTATVEDDIVFLEKILPFSIIKPLDAKKKETLSRSATNCSPPKLSVVTPLKTNTKNSLQNDQNLLMPSPYLSPPVLDIQVDINHISSSANDKIIHSGQKTGIPSCRKCKQNFSTKKERVVHKKLCGKVYKRVEQKIKINNNDNVNNINLTTDRVKTKRNKSKVAVNTNDADNYPPNATSVIVKAPTVNFESQSSVENGEQHLEEVEELRKDKRDDLDLNCNSIVEFSKREEQKPPLKQSKLITNSQPTDLLPQGDLSKVIKQKFEKTTRRHHSEFDSPIRSGSETEFGRLEDFENIPLVSETIWSDESNMEKASFSQCSKKIKNEKEMKSQKAESGNSSFAEKENNHNSIDSNVKSNDEQTIYNHQKEASKDKEEREEITYMVIQNTTPEEVRKSRNRKQLLLPNRFMYNGFKEEVKTQEMRINQETDHDSKTKKRRKRSMTTKASMDNSRSSTSIGKKRKRSHSTSSDRNKRTESFHFKPYGVNV